MLLIDDFQSTGRRVATARQDAAVARQTLAAAEAQLLNRFGVTGRKDAAALADQLFSRLMKLAEDYIQAMKELHRQYPATK